MAINKVEYGDRTLIDLTQDTVTPETLLEGETAHEKTGELIRGTHVPFSGQYEDLQGKPETFPPSAHNQSANSITSGTFAGQVAAPSDNQNPAAYCLRNSKLSNNGEKPTVNGEITVGYDGKPSSVMVNGTVYPIGTVGRPQIDTIVGKEVIDGEQIPFTNFIATYDLVLVSASFSDSDDFGSVVIRPSDVQTSNYRVHIPIGTGRYFINVYVNAKYQRVECDGYSCYLKVSGIRF